MKENRGVVGVDEAIHSPGEAGIGLRPGERIDDLLTYDLKIVQSAEVFSFSLDAVLLARFAGLPPRGRVLDLCTGNGVVPLLLTTRTEAAIDGVEIQPRLADMARRSVAMNGLADRVRIVEADLKLCGGSGWDGQYDAVTVNPPYMPVQSGEMKSNPHLAMARHEIGCTLEDVAAACSRLVRPGGRVSMVHRPSRLAEIIVTMRNVNLEPKRLRFVHSRQDTEANMVLIEALKGGKPEIRLLPPLIVYREGRTYTQELLDVFYGRASELQGESASAESGEEERNG